MGIRCRRFSLVVLLLAAGCSSKPRSPQYDSKQAEETLVLALEAWKQGNIGTLAKRNPPIRFEDEDCRNGLRLADYRIAQRLIDRRGAPATSREHPTDAIRGHCAAGSAAILALRPSAVP